MVNTSWSTQYRIHQRHEIPPSKKKKRKRAYLIYRMGLLVGGLGKTKKAVIKNNYCTCFTIILHFFGASGRYVVEQSLFNTLSFLDERAWLFW